MKYLFASFLILFSVNILFSQVQFETEDPFKWIQEAQLKEKPVMIFFHAKWCKACRGLEKDYFSDPESGSYFK